MLNIYRKDEYRLAYLTLVAHGVTRGCYCTLHVPREY